MSAAVFVNAAGGDPREQIHLATYNVKGADLVRRGHDVHVDRDAGRILRSVVMKPESSEVIDDIHARLSSIVRSL